MGEIRVPVEPPSFLAAPGRTHFLAFLGAPAFLADGSLHPQCQRCSVSVTTVATHSAPGERVSAFPGWCDWMESVG